MLREPARVDRRHELDSAGGVRYGLAEVVGRGRERRWGEVLRSVEADQRVEVDDTPALELGHLDEGQPAAPGQLADAEPEPPGEDPAQGDGEPAPQLGGVPVEGDVPGVVVAVAADRLSVEGADLAALADSLDSRVPDLQEADQARARWLAHTAVTRDAADRARAELMSRGAPVGAEADDAVTAAEWLHAHRSEQIQADGHRSITADHDLADLVDERRHETKATFAPSVGTAEAGGHGGMDERTDDHDQHPTAGRR